MNVDVNPGFGSAQMAEVPPDIAHVGIVGAGQMGSGIAHVCALAGLPVTLIDIKPEALTKALATIERNMGRQVNRSVISSEDRDAALTRIATASDYEAFSNADLVI